MASDLIGSPSIGLWIPLPRQGWSTGLKTATGFGSLPFVAVALMAIVIPTLSVVIAAKLNVYQVLSFPILSNPKPDILLKNANFTYGDCALDAHEIKV